MPSDHPAAERAAPVDRARGGSRLDSLTGLRFFAAYAVLVHHFTGNGAGGGYARVPHVYPWSGFGVHGVHFFFVLSGFVLTWSWGPRDQRSHFYWRRFARIVPLHLVTTVVALPVYYLTGTGRSPFNARSLLASVVLLQAWIPRNTPTFPGNGVSWTLSDEMFFYACFPFLVLPLRRLSGRGRAVVVGAVMALVVLVAHTLRTSALGGLDVNFALRTPAFRLAQFVVGICLALAVREGRRVPGRTPYPVVLLAAWMWFAVKGGVQLLGADAKPWVDSLDEMVVPLLCAWLIGCAAQRDLDGSASVLRSRPLVLLGAWSFALYLTHQMVVHVFLSRYGRQPGGGAALLDLLGMSVLCVGISALAYYAVEHPVERFLRGLLHDRRVPVETAVMQAADEVVHPQPHAPTTAPAADTERHRHLVRRG